MINKFKKLFSKKNINFDKCDTPLLEVINSIKEKFGDNKILYKEYNITQNLSIDEWLCIYINPSTGTLRGNKTEEDIIEEIQKIEVVSKPPKDFHKIFVIIGSLIVFSWLYFAPFVILPFVILMIVATRLSGAEAKEKKMSVQMHQHKYKLLWWDIKNLEDINTLQRFVLNIYTNLQLILIIISGIGLLIGISLTQPLLFLTLLALLPFPMINPLLKKNRKND